MSASRAAIQRLFSCGRLFATATLLLWFAATSATYARELTETENAKLAETVARFDDAIKAKDIGALVKVIPPRIIKQMAQRDGMSEDEINKVMADLIDATMQALPVHSLALKLKEANRKELADGTPYLLIPTETVMSTGGEDKTLMRSQTLALMDGNEWYLLRTNDAQPMAVLREVYPEYEGVAFAEATMELFKE